MLSLVRWRSRGSWKRHGVAAAASLASGACTVSLIAAINASVGRGAASPTMVGLFILLVVGKVGGNCWARWLLSREAQRSIVELRDDLCRRIISTPLARLEQVGSVHLLGVLVKDILAIGSALEAIPACITNSFILGGGAVYLAWLSPSMLPPLSVMVVIGIIGYSALRRQAVRALREARDHEHRLLAHLRGVAEGSKELQLNRRLRRAFLAEDVGPAAEAMCRQAVRAEDAFIGTEAWTHVLFYLLVGVLIFAMPAWRPVDPTVLVGYVLAVLFMMRPIVSILQVQPVLSRGKVAQAHLEQLKLGLAPAEAPEAPASGPAFVPYERLELVGVSYGHPGGDDAFRLGPLDLSFAPGELVFLVGGNGSGKSTLAKLVAGLYAPDFGEVRLNGSPVLDAQRDDYRQLFGAVFVDSYLFDRIPDHCNPLRLAQARKYLEEFRISHKVWVEGGIFRNAGLSQGEQKRLALVTAYLEDRPFYIFDEWAANQDPLFKEIFYRKLLPELTARGKTVLVVSHDERYFTAADTVVHMEDGEVVRQGRVSSEVS